MKRFEQIKDMAEILVNGCKMGGCEECKYSEGNYPECALKYTADQLYNAGYRKASDVAREIFAEIERILSRQRLKLLFNLPSDVTREVAELKKKYTEGFS